MRSNETGVSTTDYIVQLRRGCWIESANLDESEFRLHDKAALSKIKITKSSGLWASRLQLDLELVSISFQLPKASFLPLGKPCTCGSEGLD